jgi:hypothetical protein
MRDTIESLLADYQSDTPANTLPNPYFSGAVVGSAGGGAGTLTGTVPTGAWITGQGNLVLNVAAVGISTQGFPYWDLNVAGTSSTTGLNIWFGSAAVTVAPYTAAMSACYVGSAPTNVTTVSWEMDCHDASINYTNTVFYNGITLTTAPTVFSGAGTPGSSPGPSVTGSPSIQLGFSTSTAIAIRLRIANPQVLLTSTGFSYSAVIADRGTTKRVNAPAAFTVTIPNSVLSAGQTLAYRQIGVGPVTVQGDGTSILVNRAGSYVTAGIGARINVTADMDIPNLFWVDGDTA